MTGKATVNQGGSLVNLFNQEEIERLAEEAWDHLFVQFRMDPAIVPAHLLLQRFIAKAYAFY